jgi:hypothetical protein
VTIEKGMSWGTAVARPAGLRSAHGDHELALMLTDGVDRPVAVAAGDVHTTLGAPRIAGREELTAFPIDLVHVSLDGATEIVAVAHVLACSPRSQGGWWRGDGLAVLNSEHVGRYDVAPRGHPNDGRVETLRVEPTLGVRQRLAIRSRMFSGTHLPHPAIETGSVRSASWSFDRSLRVRVDGVDVGTARTIAIRVEPDAGIVHA